MIAEPGLALKIPSGTPLIVKDGEFNSPAAITIEETDTVALGVLELARDTVRLLARGASAGRLTMADVDPFSGKLVASGDTVSKGCGGYV